VVKNGPKLILRTPQLPFFIRIARCGSAFHPGKVLAIDPRHAGQNVRFQMVEQGAKLRLALGGEEHLWVRPGVTLLSARLPILHHLVESAPWRRPEPLGDPVSFYIADRAVPRCHLRVGCLINLFLGIPLCLFFHDRTSLCSDESAPWRDTCDIARVAAIAVLAGSTNEPSLNGSTIQRRIVREQSRPAGDDGLANDRQVTADVNSDARFDKPWSEATNERERRPPQSSGIAKKCERLDQPS